VVYGFPALAAPISLGATVQVTSAPTFRLKLQAGVKPAHRRLLQKALESLIETESFDARVQIQIQSYLPLSMGLGSSGAIAVAASRALFERHNGVKAPLARVEALALHLEKFFHGTPSGLDHCTSARQRVIQFQNGSAQTVKLGQKLELVVALVGHRPSTKVTVGQLRARQEKWSSRCHRVFQLIASLVREGRNAMERGDVESLGNLMDMNHGLLSALGLSGARIDAAVHAMRAAGAYGAKLTGAGGDGGAVIGLFPNAKRAVKHLTKAKLVCFTSVIDAQPKDLV
jgi:mevalonate kinase